MPLEYSIPPMQGTFSKMEILYSTASKSACLLEGAGYGNDPSHVMANQWQDSGTPELISNFAPVYLLVVNFQRPLTHFGVETSDLESGWIIVLQKQTMKSLSGIVQISWICWTSLQYILWILASLNPSVNKQLNFFLLHYIMRDNFLKNLHPRFSVAQVVLQYVYKFNKTSGFSALKVVISNQANVYI